MELVIIGQVLSTINYIIGGASLVIGAGIALVIGQTALKKKSDNIIKDAETEAEVLKKEKVEKEVKHLQKQS